MGVYVCGWVEGRCWQGWGQYTVEKSNCKESRLSGNRAFNPPEKISHDNSQFSAFHHLEKRKSLDFPLHNFHILLHNYEIIKDNDGVLIGSGKNSAPPPVNLPDLKICKIRCSSVIRRGDNAI